MDVILEREQKENWEEGCDIRRWVSKTTQGTQKIIEKIDGELGQQEDSYAATDEQTNQRGMVPWQSKNDDK